MITEVNTLAELVQQFDAYIEHCEDLEQGVESGEYEELAADEYTFNYADPTNPRYHDFDGEVEEEVDYFFIDYFPDCMFKITNPILDRVFKTFVFTQTNYDEDWYNFFFYTYPDMVRAFLTDFSNFYHHSQNIVQAQDN